jgi:hypothetical protein
MHDELERIAAEIEAFSQAKVTEGRLLRWAAEIRAASEHGRAPRAWRDADPLAPLVTQKCVYGSASPQSWSRSRTPEEPRN